MEELAIKIAELLDISVQGAIDLYPVIREQYVWYRVLTGVGGWVMILGFIFSVSIGITYSIRRDTRKYAWRDDEVTEEWASIDRVFKVALSIFALLIVIGIATDILIPFLAPDIILIKDFLG